MLESVAVASGLSLPENGLLDATIEETQSVALKNHDALRNSIASGSRSKKAGFS